LSRNGEQEPAEFVNLILLRRISCRMASAR